MKNLQELYNEIMENDELKKAFSAAAQKNAILEFAKEHGVESTMDEIKAFLEEQNRDDARISSTELENAAGGGCIKEGLASYYGDSSCNQPY